MDWIHQVKSLRHTMNSRNLNSCNALLSVLATTSSMLLAACSSTPLAESKPAMPVASSTMTQPADARSVATVTAPPMDQLNDPRGVLVHRSVYFDYDSYGLKDEFKPVITAHSRFLGANPGRHILIQGNTDERGGSEYNLALGQKRAEVLRKSMALLGVPESQMEAVSLGKEKPKATGHDEASYAENRRDDIVY
jgi:peptidoglycan-associated lipoprotein